MIDNYELYKVFYTVATTLSFTKAAKQLSNSQSAVSQSIKLLEKELNQTLLIRTTKKVQLTPEGEILFRHIEPAIKLIQHAEKKLIEAKQQSGQIRIAANDTICRYFLTPYFQKLHAQFPTEHIKIITATSSQCAELLKNGQVDIIIVNYHNEYFGGNIVAKEIKLFQDVFVANEKYMELTNERPDFIKLLSYPLLMLDKSTTTSEFLHSLFQQKHLELVADMELSSNDLLLDLAKIGMGIAFVPDYCLTGENSEKLFIVKTQEDIPKRKLVLSYNKYSPISKSMIAFINNFQID